MPIEIYLKNRDKNVHVQSEQFRLYRQLVGSAGIEPAIFAM